MADTGENRQITARANAKSAEAVRRTKRSLSAERSTLKKLNATFGVQSARVKKPKRRDVF